MSDATKNWPAELKMGLQKMLAEAVELGGAKQEHVQQTPERYVRALIEIFGGVHQQPEKVLNTMFKAGEDKEMIHVKDITFFSTCSHHLIPFFGKMSFAYIPNEHIVGLSKIPRLVDMYSRRPQVQEELTSEIVNAFNDIVKPKGCGLVVRGYHMCCMARGIKQPTSFTETSALRGIFKNGETKAEFITSANAQNWKVF